MKESLLTRRPIIRATKTAIIQAAFGTVDEKGLNNISLKVVAERPNIHTSLLYNHIENLDDLLREVAHNEVCIMDQRMARATIGKFGDTVVKITAIEYLNYIIEHREIYEIVQQATWHGTDETVKTLCEYTDLLKTFILSCHFGMENVSEILNLLTEFLHGYTVLQLQYALSDPRKVRTELTIALDTVLAGIYYKYDSE